MIQCLSCPPSAIQLANHDDAGPTPLAEEVNECFQRSLTVGYPASSFCRDDH
eukprot:CAMPEP_0172048680 /NCGR_PEP_ID=MMETSP1043-20130122/1660_1 /TAXON_ID=464988 /ORGANISM="Hemiselmis andersenii, Strain CCMP441" /LENGTH=51 /DNA_ID=CAMNT_0012707595 /DNA_START=60 /DNA_END=212 /DNA_ORIENTATION=-